MAEDQTISDIEARSRFMRDIHAKVLKPPKQDKPKKTEGAQHK